MRTHIVTILPRTTTVSQAKSIAKLAGVDLWITDKGQTVVSPQGLPGWQRLTNRQLFKREAPCAA